MDSPAILELICVHCVGPQSTNWLNCQVAAASFSMLLDLSSAASDTVLRLTILMITHIDYHFKLGSSY